MGKPAADRLWKKIKDFFDTDGGFLLGIVLLAVLGVLALGYLSIALGFMMPAAGLPSQVALGVTGAHLSSGVMWSMGLLIVLAFTTYPMFLLEKHCQPSNWVLFVIPAAILVVPIAVVYSWAAPGVVAAGLGWYAWRYVQLRQVASTLRANQQAIALHDGTNAGKSLDKPAAEKKLMTVTAVVLLATMCGAFVMMCPYIPAIPAFLGLTAVASKWVFVATVAVAVPALFGLLHTVFLSPRPADARSGFKHVAWLSLLSVLSSPLIVAACMAFLPAAPGLATAMAWVGGSGVAQFFGMAGVVAGFGVVLTAMGAGVRALQAWLPESSKRSRMALNILGGMMMLGAPAAVCTWVAGPALGLISWISAIPSTFGAAAAGLGVVFGGTGLVATLIAGLSGLWQRGVREVEVAITTAASSDSAANQDMPDDTARAIAEPLSHHNSNAEAKVLEKTAEPPCTPDKLQSPSPQFDTTSSTGKSTNFPVTNWLYGNTGQGFGNISPTKMASLGLAAHLGSASPVQFASDHTADPVEQSGKP